MGCMSGILALAYVIIYFLYAGQAVQLTAMTGRPYTASFSLRVIDLLPSVWSEYITSAQGKVIQRAGVPLEGPRQCRYNKSTAQADGSTRLNIANVALDDGGQYSFEIELHGGTFETIINILVVGDMQCNGSEPHVVTDGDHVVYSCSFTYQGLMVQSTGVWEGEGLETSCCKLVNYTAEPVATAAPGSCNTGVASYTVRLPVYPALNGTTRNYTIYDQSKTGIAFRYVTGELFVQCKEGFKGETCTERITCVDKPCANGASCSNVTSGGYKCRCTEHYSGVYCTTPVPCVRGRCLNDGNCSEDASGAFNCTCADDFTGVYCEQDPDAPCEESMCLNGGVCDSFAGGNACKCTPRYTGKHCTIPVRCSPGRCVNGGVCAEDSGLAFSCHCRPSYMGTYCELPVSPDPVPAPPLVIRTRMLPFDTYEKKNTKTTTTTEQNVTTNATSPVEHLEGNDTTELDEVDYDIDPDVEGKTTTTTSASSLKYLALLCLLLPLTCCVLAVYFVARRRRKKKHENKQEKSDSWSSESTDESSSL